MWKYYALLSAFFAALTAVLAKVGVSGIIVLAGGNGKQIAGLTWKPVLFLVLSGIATGLSWLCYFKALELGDVSKVAPIDKLSVVFAMILAFLFLREPVSAQVLAGGCLILLGSLVILW